MALKPQLMYIISTSFTIEPVINEKWLDFFKTKFIPFLRNEGFDKIVFTKVLTNQSDIFTYSLQVYIKNLEEYKEFNDRIFNEYLSISVPIFGVKALHFSTLLKMVDY